MFLETIRKRIERGNYEIHQITIVPKRSQLLGGKNMIQFVIKMIDIAVQLVIQFIESIF